jgi:flavin-dependent dehydrogenase
MDTIPGFPPRYDAVIVGARCAGASTALLLARAGAKVLLIDRQAYGSDVTSTHALMRTGVLQLQRWGLMPRIMAADTPAIRHTTFHYGDEAVRLNIKPEHGVEHLCAPRRTVLDRILVDAAREAGADVRHGVRLLDLEIRADGRVVGAWLKDANGTRTLARSDIVIGADGRQSTVAGFVGADTYVEGTNATGCVFGYFENVPDDGLHWYFGEGVAAGVIPTNHGQHCVFVGVPRQRFAATFRRNLDGGFQRIAAANSRRLCDALANARLVGRLRGFAGTPGYLKQCHGPGWALVGDAAYFKDPLTAHGITDALRDAELLAGAVLDGRTQAMADYQQARDALSRPLFDVTDAIASFRWTLDEVKGLHGALSTAMRAEGHHIAQLSTAATLAA